MSRFAVYAAIKDAIDAGRMAVASEMYKLSGELESLYRNRIISEQSYIRGLSRIEAMSRRGLPEHRWPK